jgi:hypothetical protein
MPSLKFLARRFSDRTFGTAFDRTMARAKGDARKRFLFFWNRGLGDIALGLVPLFLRIRKEVPGAVIEVLTREELRAAFELAGADAIHVIPGLEREARVALPRACASLGIDLEAFAAAFDYPDPNRWLDGHRGEYPPVLAWPTGWDALADRFPVPRRRRVIAAHVNTETASYYGYVKDWPAEAWRELFRRNDGDDVQWLLVGQGARTAYDGPNITDLRGRTSFAELMSLVRHRCTALVAPDGGVLTMSYYLAGEFPLDVVSLWSDPRQGILLQGCPSPNARLRHTPLIAPNEDLRNLSVDAVAAAIEH